MTFNTYGVIVLLSVAAGFISAVLLCRRCGISRQTYGFTAMLNAASLFMFSFLLAFYESGGKGIGFAGLGAAFGLMVSMFISVLIHKEKPLDLIACWTVSTPLMYSLSKLGCLSAGCCGGSFFRIPVQLADTAAFFLIYVISLVIFFRNKLKAVFSAMILSFIARIGLDFFRDSHEGMIISLNQILVVTGAAIAIIGYFVVRSIQGRRLNKIPSGPDASER